MKSMTGFGRAKAENAGQIVTVEIKSVNSRFLDLSFRLPRSFQAMEMKIREMLKKNISRGKVEVYLSIEDGGEKEKKLLVNTVLAKRYKEEIEKLSKELDLPFNLSGNSLFFYPEVFHLTEEEDEDNETVILEIVDAAIQEFVRSRSLEGEKLRADLEMKLQEMEDYLRFLKEKEPKLRIQYENRLRKKIEESLAGREIDEGRLLEEVAIFSDKVSTDEEITRLDSHVHRMQAILKEEQAVGRDLDFLMQEMNRESNTILSKASDLEITDIGLKAKNCIEKMREQVQNIE